MGRGSQLAEVLAEGNMNRNTQGRKKASDASASPPGSYGLNEGFYPVLKPQ